MILKDGKEYINISSDHKNNAANSREDLILWQEDFENNAQGWTTDSGWHLTIDEYYSATHSMHSPNDESTLSNYWDLVSPAIELSALGEGETMHFGFFIKNDMPDDDGDGNSYLDDYYHISIKSLDFLSWHASSMDALDGNSYWCGDEEVGGYLDNWMEFMDTPEFTVPSNGILTADMMWKIEDPAGADTWGETCADGWDAANVRISIDSGDTWSLLHAANYPYDFICGHGWITNDSEYDTGGSLHHLASGWGGNQDWVNVSFDLSEYTNQNVIVRFAFASDPAYCTLDIIILLVFMLTILWFLERLNVTLKILVIFLYPVMLG